MSLLKCPQQIRYKHFLRWPWHIFLIIFINNAKKSLMGHAQKQMCLCRWQSQRDQLYLWLQNFLARRSLRTLSTTFPKSNLFSACQWTSFYNANFQSEQSHPKLGSQRKKKTTKPGPVTEEAWGWDNEREHFYSLVQYIASLLFSSGIRWVQTKWWQAKLRPKGKQYSIKMIFISDVLLEAWGWPSDK